MDAIKMVHREEIRRIRCPPDFSTLHARVVEAFGASAWRLRFCDDEGDLCTICDDATYEEALRYCAAGVLRVLVDATSSTAAWSVVATPCFLPDAAAATRLQSLARGLSVRRARAEARRKGATWLQAIIRGFSARCQSRRAAEARAAEFSGRVFEIGRARGIVTCSVDPRGREVPGTAQLNEGRDYCTGRFEMSATEFSTKSVCNLSSLLFPDAADTGAAAGGWRGAVGGRRHIFDPSFAGPGGILGRLERFLEQRQCWPRIHAADVFIFPINMEKKRRAQRPTSQRQRRHRHGERRGGWHVDRYGKRAKQRARLAGSFDMPNVVAALTFVFLKRLRKDLVIADPRNSIADDKIRCINFSAVVRYLRSQGLHLSAAASAGTEVSFVSYQRGTGVPSQQEEAGIDAVVPPNTPRLNVRLTPGKYISDMPCTCYEGFRTSTLSLIHNIAGLRSDVSNFGGRSGGGGGRQALGQLFIVLDEFSAYSAYTVAALVGSGLDHKACFLTYHRGVYSKMELTPMRA